MGRRALSTVPGFGPALVRTAVVIPLPGLTNRVYRIDSDAGSFVLRVPGPGTEGLIDRRAEEANARRAAAAGIGPEVLHFGAGGLMLTRYIDDTKPLDVPALEADEGAAHEVARAFRRLHEECPPFETSFEPFAIADRYLAVLDASGGPLVREASRLLFGMAPVRAALIRHRSQERPCHCDPTPGNVLLSGGRVWLIDWEYSGQNDPAWDLAYFALEAPLDGEAERRFLSAYAGGVPGQSLIARVTLTKPVVRLLAGLWALIQHARGNASTDFEAYARGCLEDVDRLLDADETRAALTVLAAL